MLCILVSFQGWQNSYNIYFIWSKASSLILYKEYFYKDTNEIPSGLLISETDPIPPSHDLCSVEQRLPIVEAVLVIGVFNVPGVEIEEVTGNANPETGVAVGVKPVDVNVSKLRLGTPC